MIPLDPQGSPFFLQIGQKNQCSLIIGFHIWGRETKNNKKHVNRSWRVFSVPSWIKAKVLQVSFWGMQVQAIDQTTLIAFQQLFPLFMSVCDV